MIPYKQHKQNRANRRKYAIEKLGGKCVHCGSISSLEFDHITRSSKIFEISQNLESSLTILDRELDKCQLLCKPCHISKTKAENGFTGYKHGTASMYTNKKCRCQQCKQSWAEDRRSYQINYRLTKNNPV